MRRLFALLAFSTAAVAFAGEADAHLRAGAAHFRAGRFDDAVLEFKVARELGAGAECPWYVAAALTRAGRHLDALEAFELAAQTSPGSADALFLYYRGVACSDAQLVVCAAEAFALAAKSSGPKVAGAAQKLADEARAVLSREPEREAIDALLTRAALQRASARPKLSALLAREALALSERRKDGWKREDARRLLSSPPP